MNRLRVRVADLLWLTACVALALLWLRAERRRAGDVVWAEHQAKVVAASASINANRALRVLEFVERESGPRPGLGFFRVEFEREIARFDDIAANGPDDSQPRPEGLGGWPW